MTATTASIQLKVEIRRNSDGVIAEEVWPNWEYNTFWWEDGNASCDCNRELFFLRARKENDDIETVCGGDRFNVRLSNAETGEVLYNEFQDSAPGVQS